METNDTIFHKTFFVMKISLQLKIKKKEGKNIKSSGSHNKYLQPFVYE